MNKKVEKTVHLGIFFPFFVRALEFFCYICAESFMASNPLAPPEETTCVVLQDHEDALKEVIPETKCQ